MSLLAVKLLLAPAFVVSASLVARRFGPTVGGLVGGLPVVAGPILLILALDHGEAFASRAAAGTTLGLVSLTAFVVVYATLVSGRPWWLCLPAGWLAFLLVTAPLDRLEPAPVVALTIASTVFVLALLVLPRAPAALDRVGPPVLPWWDLPARAASAAALVLAVTAASASLGAHLSGLLAPFPIIASILATFTHAHDGPVAARRLLRGLVMGFFAFALFCFVVAVTVEPLGIAAAFSLATVTALAAQVVALMVIRTPAGTRAMHQRSGG